MKRMILVSVLVLLIPVIVYSQDKIEAPVWNVGDKWMFTAHPTMVVVKADDSTYTVKSVTSKEENVYIYDKASLNILYSLEGDKRIPYKRMNKQALDFPLSIGKAWKDRYSTNLSRGNIRLPQEYTFIESRTVLGWEDVEVRAGKFKALKMEVKHERLEDIKGQPKEGRLWVWYSPEVKNLIKCQMATVFWTGYYDWQLSTFQLRK
jgi:hypothetical protein